MGARLTADVQIARRVLSIGRATPCGRTCAAGGGLSSADESGKGRPERRAGLAGKTMCQAWGVCREGCGGGMRGCEGERSCGRGGRHQGGLRVPHQTEPCKQYFR